MWELLVTVVTKTHFSYESITAQRYYQGDEASIQVQPTILTLSFLRMADVLVQ
jgi:hypothetical protein